MSEDTGRAACPHCGGQLSRFVLPEAGGWDEPYHLACFNDECPYFVRGRAWMREKYGVSVSYRYRVDPASGHAFPIAVWSTDALRDRITKEPTP